MGKEIWKDIEGYEGLYQVSGFGRVKSLARCYNNGYHKERILKPRKQTSGHLSVALCKNGIIEQCRIHRLVLDTFVGPCPVNMESCHNDSNPSNNFIANLRYDTRKNNHQDKIKYRGKHCPNSKLKIKEILKIKYLLKNKIMIQKKIAKKFNISEATVSGIKSGKIWGDINE